MARRSKNSQRLINRANMLMGQGQMPNRRRTGTSDWVVSSASVDPTGTAQAGTAILTSWNAGLGAPSTAGIIGSGAFVTNQAILVQPTPMTSTPTVGRLRVNRIKGRISVFPFVTNGTWDQFSVFVGIYLAELNNTTTKWEVRNLLSTSDVARDDFFYLENRVFLGQNGAPVTPVTQNIWEGVLFDLDVPISVVIGGGQALHVTIAAVSGNNMSVVASTAYRTNIGPVA